MKTLAVIALLALASSAAFAQGTFTFGFLTADASFEFCNYELFATGGTDNYYLTGYDVLNLCPTGLPVAAAPIVGFAIKPPVAAFTPVYGSGVYEYADALEDAIFDAYSGIQITALTKTKVSKIEFGHYGWANYAGFGSFSFLNLYGFLTDTLYAPTKMPNMGNTSFAGTKASAQTHGNNIVQLNKSVQ